MHALTVAVIILGVAGVVTTGWLLWSSIRRSDIEQRYRPHRRLRGKRRP